MAKRRLTDRLARSMPVGAVYRDTEIRGFAARKLSPKRCAFEIRREGRNRLFTTLGHSDVMGVAEARSAAKKILAKHELGERVPNSLNLTLESAWPLFEEHLKARTNKPVSAKTIRAYEDCLARIDERIRKKQLRELASDPSIMTHEHARIKTRTDDGSTWRQKGYGKEAADSSGRFVRALYNFVRRKKDHTLPDFSPCRDIDLAVNREGLDLQVMAPEELPSWWRAVQGLENPLRQKMHLFCLLSGLRRNELAEMEWKYFGYEKDLKRSTRNASTFRIPKPKGGVRRAYDLVLSKPMLEILREAKALGMKRWGQRDPERAARWVWPGSGRAGHMGGLDNDKKFGVHTYNHGLRRTYISLAKDADVDTDTIERLINHKNVRQPVTAHYVRTTAIGRSLLVAQEKISEHLLKAMHSPESGGDDDYESSAEVRERFEIN